MVDNIADKFAALGEQTAGRPVKPIHPAVHRDNSAAKKAFEKLEKIGANAQKPPAKPRNFADEIASIGSEPFNSRATTSEE